MAKVKVRGERFFWDLVSNLSGTRSLSMEIWKPNGRFDPPQIVQKRSGTLKTPAMSLLGLATLCFTPGIAGALTVEKHRRRSELQLHRAGFRS